MEPLLSMTKPMLTGTSSRLKTESFCSALSSNTRKFSSLRPSTNLPRSSRTVVCRTTRLTSTLMRPPCWAAVWPGGSGCEFGRARGLTCAKRGEALRIRKPAHRISAGKIARAKETEKFRLLMAGSVVAGFGVNTKGREPFGCTQFDFDLAPACVMHFVARMVSQNILVTQLHANFSGDVRKIFELF